MRIYCIGFDHRAAPLELRERFPSTVRSDSEIRLLSRVRGPSPQGVVVLATCNRFEVYAHFNGGDSLPCSAAYGALAGFLAERSQVPQAAFSGYLKRYGGRGAVQHLCQVAAGVESAVLGEPEVLGQVSAAIERSSRNGDATDVMEAAFRAALQVGRRARAETDIGRGSASFASAIADVAGDAAAGGRPCVVIAGVGELGSRVARVLRKRDRSDIRLVSRTVPAAALSRTMKGVAVYRFDELADLLMKADAVVLVTSAEEPILGDAVVSRAMRARGGRPLIIVDAGVPRNADPRVGRIEGIKLLNVDDIGRRVNGVVELRRKAIPHVQTIIEEELATFDRWRLRREAEPLIAALRKKADTVREEEVRRALEMNPDLTGDARAAIETATLAVVNKLLHEPTLMLRSSTAGNRAQRLRLVQDLFALDDQGASRRR